MIEEEHFKQAMRGTASWNDWRCAARIVHAHLAGADLSNADLSGALLTFSDLRKSRLVFANLAGADLRCADLRGANLTWANLSGADLSHADLSGAAIVEADLRSANLRCTRFRTARLTGSDLSGACLIGSHMCRGDFSDTLMHNTSLASASMGWTVLGSVDLSTARGLEKVIHYGPSVIGIETIFESEGKIPESFLRAAGVSEIFLTFLPSLTAQPIKFYTCFIAYAHHDYQCAEKIYKDLQKLDVRCWFAAEDLKIGDHFLQVIEDSVRIYDKVLIILSHASIASPWVEREVQGALEKERNGRAQVLFPVRIDDAVLTSDTEWVAHLRRSRHIADFSSWRDDGRYREAMQRLLRDLSPWEGVKKRMELTSFRTLRQNRSRKHRAELRRTLDELAQYGVFPEDLVKSNSAASEAT